MNIKKFYIGVIIAHFIIYPLLAWYIFETRPAGDDRTFIFITFVIGFVISIFLSAIIPLIKLKKENHEKRNLETPTSYAARRSNHVNSNVHSI